MIGEGSREAFETAKKYIPGGVNSPVRAFANVGRHPLFIKSANGSKIYDIDGNEFIDYVGSWGPMLLGHAFEPVVDAVRETALSGTSFGAPCVAETRLAQLICDNMPGVDTVRMVNSGTEATMSALRLARGFTGRDIIIKFEGCYHGHSDSLLIKAGSGALTFGSASSAGVPQDIAKHTLVLPYNNKQAVTDAFERYNDKIAAVILEPVCGNMGVVPPKDGFLEHLRRVTEENGTVLIIDEVMTGFRLSPSGACGLFGITADIVTFGKIIGGGLPVGAYGGRRDIMTYISPTGPVYQAGTLSGNPLAMAAGIAQLEYIFAHRELYSQLERTASMLADGLATAANDAGVPVRVNRVGSMLSVFFTENEVYDFETACTSDTDSFSVYFNSMLESGIYIAPSQFESVFVSAAHMDGDIERTIIAAKKAFEKTARK